MKDSYIKISRRLLDWEWFQDSNMVHLFIYILLQANFKDGNWQGSEVKRGQYITGRKSLSRATGISERTIRTCLQKLEATNEVTIEPTSKWSIITVVKYDKYQGFESKAPSKTPEDRPSIDHQSTTIEEERRKKRIKDIVEHLNLKTNSAYKSTTQSTTSKINARIEEGATYEDFVKVIDSKSTEWLNKSDMSKYLRPETLFGSKFEGYLQNATKIKIKTIAPDYESLRNA